MLWSVIKLRRGSWLLFTAAWLFPLWTATAQQPLARSAVVRYRVRGWPDAPVTLGAAGLAALPELLGDRLPVASCGPCDPLSLPSIDRGTVGLASGDAASNIAMLVTVGGSALLVATSRRGEPDAGRSVLEDAAVMAQVAAVDAALTGWLKVAVHRPRPERYTSQGAQFTGIDESRSFPSGHASFAFAAAASAASILHRRGALHRHRLVTALLFVSAATTAALRVQAHRHFPTDVLAGAALGTAVGWVIPQLHPVLLQ